ncbi:Hypothetical predicted protein [Podarcis lilfordi]|uniref:Uncharacterized protein n=1 Tax=Podarcis lilfordi TaxID=74358 RepID=A0AA35K7U2_9SAUR|nr:Hypothetical predicted protein [Podarcis lilfordi]
MDRKMNRRHIYNGLCIRGFEFTRSDSCRIVHFRIPGPAPSGSCTSIGSAPNILLMKTVPGIIKRRSPVALSTILENGEVTATKLN